jgi:hypothetical protein
MPPLLFDRFIVEAICVALYSPPKSSQLRTSLTLLGVVEKHYLLAAAKVFDQDR